jgi:hypothetical protein
LPYTETIENMFADFARQINRPITLREFWLGLLNIRKAGQLGRITKKKGSQ